MKFIVGSGIFAISLAVAPAYLPTPLQDALGVSPMYLAQIPFIPTDQKTVLREVDKRFADAPDIVHSIVARITLDPDYRAKELETLAPDLLSDAYAHRSVTLDDDTHLVTHSSILAQAVTHGRFDIVDAIIEKTGTDTNAAMRLAIESALISQTSEEDSENAQHFLEVFARAGGSAARTRRTSTDVTLAEILLEKDRDALMYFVSKGFEPFMSLDVRHYDHGGISLGEIATLHGSEEQLRGVDFLLHKGGVPQPGLRVSANMLANLKSRSDLADRFDDLVQELELRSTPVDLAK